MKKILTGLFAVLLLAVSSLWSNGNVTVTLGDGTTYEFTDVPDDFVNLVNENKSIIESALADHNITSSDLNKYKTEINEAYKNITTALGTPKPYTTAVNGLNNFSDDLKNSLPNSQIQQNVWANSWIGYLVQIGNGRFCPNFGLGANIGASSLNMASFKEMGDAFKIDLGGLPSKLVFPTITFDARVGGVRVFDLNLPFDFGFTLSGLNSSKIGLDQALKDVKIDYFSIGFDVRYCLWEPHILDPKLSVGAGFYYTSGKVSIDNSSACAGLDFKSTNFTLNSQISTKLLFFRPFAGFKLMFTNSKVDWYVKNIDWTEILSAPMDELVANGLLPRKVSGGADGFKFRPVVQGGFAFDLGVIDLTFSGSYDFSSTIWGAAFSLRFSL